MYDGDFVKIYEVHKMRLFSYVLYKTKAKHVAEDITSEAFLKLVKELQTNRKILDYAVAWLYRVASNLIIDYQRSAYYNLTSTETEETAKKGMNSDNEEQDADIFVVEYTAVLDTLAKEEKQKMVLDAMKELRDEDQEVIELRLFQELPFKQLAVILESTESAVKMKYGRAIEKLKDIVDKKV
jgi:RNA polymerase sigma-70 factor (ECF subfamily)